MPRAPGSRFHGAGIGKAYEMYSWVVTRLVGFLYGKVSKGDLGLPLLGIAKDARLLFPGNSSFGGEHRGKSAIERWMRRFASLRPEFTVHDAAAAGPPWNMRIFMRFSDRIVAPDGYVYENEGMEYIAIKQGLIREIRIHLDTEKVSVLDRHLAGTDEQSRATPLETGPHAGDTMHRSHTTATA